MLTSPNVSLPAYADSDAAALRDTQGPWTCYPLPDFSQGCNRKMMLEVIRYQGCTYFIAEGEGR